MHHGCKSVCYNGYMPQETLRNILLLELIYITGFWILTTSPKGNLKGFFAAIKDKRSGLPVLVFELLCFVQVLFFSSPQFSLGRFDWFMGVAGLCISLYGAGLASWAKWTMGTNWGRPAQHDRKIQKQLVTDGPFAFSRNPIYVGLLFLFIGLEFALQSYGFILAIPLFLAIRKAVMTEEALLLTYFGKSYARYKKRVPRFF